MHEHLRHHGIILIFRRIHSLLPPRRAQAPFASRFQADGAKVVAARGGEVEKFFSQHACYGVVATVFGADATVAITVEACHGGFGEETQGLFEDWVEVLVGRLLVFEEEVERVIALLLGGEGKT